MISKEDRIQIALGTKVYCRRCRTITTEYSPHNDLCIDCVRYMAHIQQEYVKKKRLRKYLMYNRT